MKKMKVVVGILLVTVWGGTCLAADAAKENVELKARIEKLEKELTELKKMVTEQEAAKTGVPEKAEPEKPEPVTEKKPVVSGLDVEIYGRLKLDAAYDTSRIDNGNYAKWVESENQNKNDDQFNMTANETRLGLNIKGPDISDVKTSGRVEMDFYEGGAENKSRPMMRHAYVNLDWPQKQFSILAGQTSDVISPLYPDTLNYSVGWWVGNIGYRRPQIRLTKKYPLENQTELKLEGALTRSIGLSGVLTPGDAGEDAGIPGFQGRVSATFPSWGCKPTTLGFSGHWAKEEYDITPTGGNDRFDSWSLNIDILQPVNEWLTLKGELFTGENLSAYLGGIGQGVNTTLAREISSRGGWLAANLGPFDRWRFNAGLTIDDVDDDDLRSNTTNRAYNRSIFCNVIYSVDKNAEIGFELSQWHTKYEGQRNADSLRAQTSFIYKF